MTAIILVSLYMMLVAVASIAKAQNGYRSWPMPRSWHAPRPWFFEALCLHDGLLRDVRGRVLRRVGWGEGSWTSNTGNGYFGGLQFTLSTWSRAGGTGFPHEHSPREQIYRARMIWKSHGGSWSEWGAMRVACGLR